MSDLAMTATPPCRSKLDRYEINLVDYRQRYYIKAGPRRNNVEIYKEEPLVSNQYIHASFHERGSLAVKTYANKREFI